MPDSLVTQADIDAIETGINAALGQIETRLAAEAFAADLPMFGTQLKQAYDAANSALTTINTLKNTIVAALDNVSNLSNLATMNKDQVRAALQSALDNALAGLGNEYQKLVNVTVGDTGDIQLVFDTGRTTSFNFDADDLGMDALGLDLDGTATATLAYDFNFTAGLDDTGFYLDGTNTHLTLDANVSLGNLTANADFGYLTFNASNIQDGLENSLGQAVNSGGGDTLALNFSAGLTGGLLRSFNTDFLNVSASGNVDLDLHLGAAMAGDGAPSIDGDLHVDYTFAGVLLNGNVATDWGDVLVKLDNVQYDLGDFIENFVSPVFEKIAAVLQPINQALDVLRYDLGTILPNDWEEAMDIAGGPNGSPDGKVTILDLIALTGADVSALGQFLDVLQSITDVANLLTADLFNPGVKLDVGGYSVILDDLSSATQALNQLDFASGTFESAGADFLQLISGLADGTQDGSTLYTDILEGREATALVRDILDSSLFTIPIIQDPSKAIQFLMGQTVDIAKFDMAPIYLGPGFDTQGNLTKPVIIASTPIWLVPPITLDIGIAFQAVIDLAFGFDSSGFANWANSTNFDTSQLGLIFDGLYLDDQIVNGEDKAEIILRAAVEIGGALEAGLGRISGGGNIIGELFLDLADSLVDGDGKLYFNQALANPFSLLEVDGGRITAGFRASLELGIPPFRGTVWSHQSPRVTLIDISNQASATVGPPPGLGDMLGSELNINVGARAGQRDIANKIDGSEYVEISASGPAGARISGFGYSESFPHLGDPAITRIVGDGGAGNDQLLMDSTLNIAATLSGGVGNDTLQGGAKADILNGGADDDWMIGNGGADEMHGGSGNDYLEGGAGGDIIDGGDGTFDIASYINSTSGVSIDLALASGSQGLSGDAVGDTFTGIEAYEGSSKADVIKGAGGADMFFGGDGNDTLQGRGGNDWLIGGFGSNSIDGGADYDAISYYFATAGVTINQGSSGGTATLTIGSTLLINDSFVNIEEVQGSAFADSMSGGAGTQIFQGMDGADTLNGGADNDFLVGGKGGDTLIGGSGNDIASYFSAKSGVTLNLASGGTGGDAQGDTFNGIEEVRGSDYADTITGDGLANTLRGYLDNDKLDGAGGDDVLEGGLGSDQLIGGAGRDEASYRNATSGISINLRTNSHTGEAFGDTFNTVEIIAGSAFSDTIRGSDAITSTAADREEILGNGGADFLYGGLGDDTLRGGDDNDRLEGEEGNDQLFGDAGNDTLLGGAGADEFTGGAGNDSIDGGADRDRVTYIASTSGISVNLSVASQTKGGTTVAALRAFDGLGGLDSFVAAGGMSTVEDATGSNFADWMVGSEGGSELKGMAGADRLYGLNGNDTLNGGAGADALDGSGGNDTASYADDGAGVTADLQAGTATDGSGSTDSLTLIENLTGSAYNDFLYGDGGVNRLQGGNGNDVMEGRGGGDVMIGGAGDDIYFVDRVMESSANDQVIEQSGGGSDLIRTYVEYGSATFIASLSSEVEDLQLLGSVKYGYGNNLSNRLMGNGGNNVLNGLGGADTFWGYSGDDIYYFDSTGDTIGVGSAFRSVISGSGEVANGGTDEIRLATANLTPVNTATSYTLDTVWGQQVENLVLIDDDRNVSLVGNARDNLLVGNAQWQTLSGGIGNDILDPRTGRDTVHGDAGSDTLRINWSAIDYDISTGLGGNPNDGYFGQYFWGPDGGNGNYYRVDFDGIEKFDITLGSGRDFIWTGDNNDIVNGGAGNDHISSGKGVDIIDGGAGNDRWTADKFAATLAQPMLLNLRLSGVQATYMGTGTVRGIEMVTLITGAGNDVITTLDARFDDSVTTNGGNDRVVFAGGRDVVDMGADFDTLVIDWSDIDYDQYTGFGGSLENGYFGAYYWGPDGGNGNYDRVDFSGVERFEITMGSGKDYVATGDADDIVNGGAGNDHINSGKGVDIIDGGVGDDRWTADKSAATADQPMLLNLRLSGVQATYMGAGTVRGIEMVTLITGAGNDVITTLDARFDDWLSTFGGNDRVVFAGGRDVVDMGAGFDTLVIDWSDIDYDQYTGFGGSLTDGYFGAYYWGPDGGNGNYDRVDFSGVERFEITMGSGNDYVVTGDADDIVKGGAGNDHINSGKGADVIDGGAGNDRWTADKTAATSDQAIILNLRATDVQSSYLGTGTVRGIEMVTLSTGAGNDVITTLDARFDDWLSTFDGDDRVVFAGGRDAIDMGAGLDTLVIDWSDIDYDQATGFGGSLDAGYFGAYYWGPDGGNGNYDRVDFSGVERFEITMGSGRDHVITGDGNDIVTGGAGDDLLRTGKGADLIVGGDNLDASRGVDRWTADKSNASAGMTINLTVNTASTYKIGGVSGSVAGIEALGLPQEFFQSGAFADVITTMDARYDDYVMTNGGADRVVVAGGRDNVQMGAGVDTLVIDWSDIDYSQTTSLGGDLAGGYYGTYYWGPDSGNANYDRVDFDGVEKFDIAMGSGHDYIVTGDGDDRVRAGAGNDHIDSRGGADYIDGGEGNDRWQADKSFATASQAINVNLTAATTQSVYLGAGSVRGIEMLTLITGAGNDTIVTRGEFFSDIVTTNAGNDSIKFAGGRDGVDAGAGNDLLIVDWSAIDYGQTTSFAGNTTDGYTGVYFWGPDSGNGDHNRVDFTGIERFDIAMGSGNDFVVTGDFNDKVRGGAGDDHLVTGQGADIVDGGTGNDRWQADKSLAGPANAIVVDLRLAGIQSTYLGSGTVRGIEMLSLITGRGDDRIVTLDARFNDVITTNLGADVVTIAGGRDNVDLGGGVDTLVVDWSDITYSMTTTISGTLAAGHSGVYFWGPDGGNGDFDRVDFVGVEKFDIRMGSGNDNIITGDGDDNVDGGLGADTIDGRGGSDTVTYAIRTGAIVVALNRSTAVTVKVGGANEDSIVNVENVIGGSGNDELTGDTANNRLEGGAGDDIINGKAGNDYLDGGAGIDTLSYQGATAGVTVSLLVGAAQNTGGAGTDTVLRFENLVGSNFADRLTGTGGANTIDGGIGADRMIGGAGNDTYLVDNLGDVAVENANQGYDIVYSRVSHTLGANVEELVLTGTGSVQAGGNASNNKITGNTGNNRIDGKGGADMMTGLTGNDTYIVDNAGDVVVEAANEGIDRVVSRISYTLTANVEKLNLIGTDAINGTANGLDNFMVGNGAANIMDGLAGNDRLDGGAGADTLRGGTGDDRYIVDDANDVIVELANAGTDIVEAKISFALANNVENLVLRGTGDLNGTGNALANAITGTPGANRIDGGGGADIMRGKGGHDVYVVDNAGDLVVEGKGAGIDTVESTISYTLAVNVENLSLLGSANLNGTGNRLANTIVGNGGNNVLDGDFGNDLLTGGAGADSFKFTGNFGRDKVTDFAFGTDHIDLSGLRAINGGAALTFADLKIFNSGTSARIALDLNHDGIADRIDLDGNGSLDLAFVDLLNRTATQVTASDFIF